MIDAVVRGLLAAGIPAEELDADVLRDALWLALVVQERERAEIGTSDGPGPIAPDSQVSPEPGPGQADESGQGVAPPIDAQPAAPAGTADAESGDVELFPDVGGGAAGDGRAASALSLPAPAPLPNALALTRSLRPFRRARRASTDEVLDPEATVRATVAAGGELQPVFRRRPEPRFRAHLVVDDSPSMAVWGDTLASFELVLRRSSSFRDVTGWALTEGDDGPVLATRQGRVARPPWLASTDESVVVVATDARADRWRSDEWWAMLRHWGARTTLALLNPLPSTWWRRTGLPPDPVRIRALSRVGTNLDLGAPLPRRLRMRADGGPGTALPVLTLDPVDLQNWGRTVASSNPAGCLGVVLLEGTPQRTAARIGGRDAVAGFRQLAGPAARRLAALLSASDVHTIETMRIVQSDLVPGSTAADLAQVLAGGFVDAVPSGSGHVFRIGDEAQAELHRELLADDAYAVHRSLRAALDRRTGGDDSFRVLVEDPSGPERLSPEQLVLLQASSSALSSSGLDERRIVGPTSPHPVVEEPPETGVEGPLDVEGEVELVDPEFWSPVDLPVQLVAVTMPRIRDDPRTEVLRRLADSLGELTATGVVAVGRSHIPSADVFSSSRAAGPHIFHLFMSESAIVDPSNPLDPQHRVDGLAMVSAMLRIRGLRLLVVEIRDASASAAVPEFVRTLVERVGEVHEDPQVQTAVVIANTMSAADGQVTDYFRAFYGALLGGVGGSIADALAVAESEADRDGRPLPVRWLRKTEPFHGLLPAAAGTVAPSGRSEPSVPSEPPVTTEADEDDTTPTTSGPSTSGASTTATDDREAITMTRGRSSWEIDAGTSRGLFDPANGDGFELRCSPSEAAPSGVLVLDVSDAQGAVRVVEVGADRSRVELIGWTPRADRYVARVEHVPTRPVTVALPAVADRTDDLRDALRGLPLLRPVVRRTAGEDPATIDVSSDVSPDGERIFDVAGADLPDAPELRGLRGVTEAAERIEHVARWEEVRALGGHPSDLRRELAIEISDARDPDRPPVADPAGGLDVAYREIDGRQRGFEPPALFIRLVNESARDLYAAILGLTDRYRVAIVQPTVQIRAGSTFAVRDGSEISVTLPQGRSVEPGASARDWLKLVVSQRPFDDRAFVLPGIGEVDADRRARGREIPRGLLERSGLHGPYGGIRGPGTEWCGTLVPVRLTVPWPAPVVPEPPPPTTVPPPRPTTVPPPTAPTEMSAPPVRPSTRAMPGAGEQGRDLVVVVPGLLGSVLAKDGRELFGLSVRGALGLRRNMRALNDASEDDGVVATQLVSDLGVIPGLFTVTGYTALMNALQKRAGLTEGTDLIAFPWDWRKSMTLAAEGLRRVIEPALEAARRVNPGCRLVVIGVGEGGLVAALSLYLSEGWDLTRLFVPIGTPFRGIPGVVASMSGQGGNALSRLVFDNAEFLRGLVSAYELMPDYPVVDAGDGILQKVEHVALPRIDPSRIGRGITFLDLLRRLSETIAPVAAERTVPIVGTGHLTTGSVSLRNGEVEALTSYEGEETDGDGQVPRHSAVPRGFPPERAVYVEARHGELQGTKTVLDQLVQLIGVSRSAPPPS